MNGLRRYFPVRTGVSKGLGSIELVSAFLKGIPFVAERQNPTISISERSSLSFLTSGQPGHHKPIFSHQNSKM
jgi:hypothetical protein